MQPDRVLRARCVIVGGGPAGVVLGYLLARAGIDALVLEKHADFLRDFRGDTIHPSTLTFIDELGLLEPFLRLPHTKAETLSARFGDVVIPVADFTHLPGPVHHLAFMPQWDFLTFFVGEARRYPTFALEMQADVFDLVRQQDRITGVLARCPQGTLEVRADLVIAADGRASTIRDRAALPVHDRGAPIDVLWMRVPRSAGMAEQSFGTIAAGAIFITIDRNDYYQCALVIGKGDFAAIKAGGIEAFRQRIVALAPALADGVHAIHSWDDVKLLTVRVDRLQRWYRDGLLCIGDAAHAMSPVGGVGINLAIQDAIATANILAAALRSGRVPRRLLRAVQRRRALPAAVTQTLQIAFHRLVLTRVLARMEPITLPPIARALRRFAWLRRIPAYGVGIGVRPERLRPIRGAEASTLTSAASD